MLVVLQGMDSAGKDGTIRRVFQGVNPQGVRVASFKAPSAHEAEHDFLWRVHEQSPARGEMVLFNRSHYEDVLYPRVHGLVTKPVWERRLPGDQRLRAAAGRGGHNHPQVLLAHQPGRAEEAARSTPGRPDEALEVSRVGRAGTSAVDRVHPRLRGRPLEHQHAVGTLVRCPFGPGSGTGT